MLQIHYEWLDFAFKCFESFLNGSNLYMNASMSLLGVSASIWAVYHHLGQSTQKSSAG